MVVGAGPAVVGRGPGAADVAGAGAVVLGGTVVTVDPPEPVVVVPVPSVVAGTSVVPPRATESRPGRVVSERTDGRAVVLGVDVVVSEEGSSELGW
jgi:hypothetical protein